MNTVKFNDSRTAVNMPLAVRFLKVTRRHYETSCIAKRK